MRRRLFPIVAALTMVVSVFAPAASASGLTAEDLTAVGLDAFGVESDFSRAAIVDVNGQKLLSVIVDLEGASLAAYTGDLSGLPATSPSVTGDAKLDTTSANAKRYLGHLKREQDRFTSDLQAALPAAKVTQRYDLIIGGVAALVPIDAVKTVEGLSGVKAVYIDEMAQLDTDTSPQFLGLSTPGGAWTSGYTGEGVIVGVIDSGIWPEHPSFSDPDPNGDSYPAPTGWTGTACDFGNTTYNGDDAPFTCNNKLIAAYNFTATYEAAVGLLPTEFQSARDSNGHGTHTASTSAGNGGVEATLLDVSRGVVSGIAPRAHVAMYKGCGADGCFSSDTSAAIQQAVSDGVDVINYSISGGGDPYSDVVSLTFLDAFAAGVVVTPSAGNSGPDSDTVAHREPWTLTVGASTTDRHFLSTVTLVADNDDTLELSGASVTAGVNTPTPVVLASDTGDDGLCLEPFAADTFSGEIVICQRGVIARVAKSFNVSEGGAGGMLLYNPTLQGLATDNHFIPSIHLENDSGEALLEFMASHTGVTATMTDGLATTVQGDKMAAFSSRGGTGQSLGISKPDVTAPGVQILAGHTPLPENQDGGLPGQLFQSIQGTSMSAPHTAGAAALLVDAHPDWSPAAVKSALMMTAITAGVTKEDGETAADAFDYGSGRIDPTAAIGAQLVMNTDAIDYLTMADHLWDTNYPSLYVPVMSGRISTERTFTSTVGSWERWRVWTEGPADLDISVPRRFFVRPHGSSTIGIDIDASAVPLGETRMATMYMSNGDQTLHFPITVVRNQGPVTLDHSCEAAEIAKKESTTCTIEVANTTFEDASVDVRYRAPRNVKLGTVFGAEPLGGSVLRYRDVLAAAEPSTPSIEDDAGGSPAGYLPLGQFGGNLELGATDESIANLTGISFVYGGETYSQIGVVSNGYAVVGGGDSSDVTFLNSALPDASRPNNTLAPFWTDLDPSAGGRVLANVLGDGVNSWLVIEWEEVPVWSDADQVQSFQIWIGLNGEEDIAFTYGAVSVTADGLPGDGGFLTVGAEDATGTRGDMAYFDGAGDAPVVDMELRVSSIPGAPGGSHTIEFIIEGRRSGPFTSIAEMTSDAIYGTATAVFEGEVTGGRLPRVRR